MGASFPPNAQAGVTSADLSSQVDGAKGSSLVGWLSAVAGAVGRTLRARLGDLPVSVKDFGAKGDGVTDDTAAIQAAMNAVLSINGGRLVFPAGTYLISAALTIPLWTQFAIEGVSRGGTKIVQATDNTPIFKFTKENAWGWSIRGFNFAWSNAQPAANTSAVAILADMDTHTGAGIYQGEILDITWDKGFRGFAVSEVGGTNLAWGLKFDRIVHGSAMTGAAISIYPNPSAGSPNNRIGQIYARADSATEALLRFKACSGLVIGNYEVNHNDNGVSILQMSGGVSGVLQSLRIETATYTVNGRNIVDLSDCQLNIGSVKVSTMTVNCPGGVVTLLGQNGGVGNCNVGTIDVSNAVTLTAGSFYVFGGTATRRFALGSIAGLAYFTALTNITASTTADGVVVADWDMRRLSADNGDADKVLSFGNETVQLFKTTLTAQRVVTLPAHVAPSNAYNGAHFRIVRNAAAPGAFVLSVRNAAGTVVKDIPAGTNAWVEVAYRRSTWELIGYGTL